MCEVEIFLTECVKNMYKCDGVWIIFTCHLPCAGSEAVRADFLLGGRQRGEKVRKEVKLVLAGLPYHKTSVQSKRPPSLSSTTPTVQKHAGY